jgi:hypothetical protein
LNFRNQNSAVAAVALGSEIKFQAQSFIDFMQEQTLQTTITFQRGAFISAIFHTNTHHASQAAPFDA